LMLLIPVVGVGTFVAMKFVDGTPTWTFTAGGFILFVAMLLAALVLLVLGLLGRKVERRLAPGEIVPAPSGSGGVVAIVLVVILAMTCVPLLGAGLLAVGVAVFWVTPVQREANDGGVPHAEYDSISRPMEATETLPARKESISEPTRPDPVPLPVPTPAPEAP
jgi:hypothetical protein